MKDYKLVMVLDPGLDSLDLARVVKDLEIEKEGGVILIPECALLGCRLLGLFLHSGSCVLLPVLEHGLGGLVDNLEYSVDEATGVCELCELLPCDLFRF